MDDLILNKQSNLGIRTGSQYLDGLRDNRNVWMHGKKVKDVTNEDGLKRCAATLAAPNGCDTLSKLCRRRRESCAGCVQARHRSAQLLGWARVTSSEKKNFPEPSFHEREAKP